MRKLSLLVPLIFILAAASIPVIKVKVNYRNANAPKEVKALIFVEPHPDNRTLIVILDGVARLRKDEQLEGENARKSREVIFDRVPAGFYTLHVILYGTDSEKPRGVESVEICRAGMDISCAGEDQ